MRLGTAVVLIAVCFLLVVGCVFVLRFRVREEPAVPSEVRDFYEGLNKWLDEKLTKWRPAKLRRVMFNAHHILASENAVLHVPEDVCTSFLNALIELGADTISFNIYPEVFKEKAGLYDKLVNIVKKSGRRLVIVYMVSSRTFKKAPSFEEYLRVELECTRILVERYRPDFYGIFVEPSTMQRRVGARFTLDEWVRLVVEVDKLVKEVSPETKTFISLLLSEAKVAVEAFAQTGVDIIAFNVWSPRQLEKVGEYIDGVRKCGKTAWIWMNWWSTQKDPETGEVYVWFRDCYWQDVDIKWVKAVTYFAVNHGAEMVSPFFTEALVYCNKEYGKPLKDQYVELLKCVRSGKRTKFFYAYRDFIKEVKSFGKG